MKLRKIPGKLITKMAKTGNKLHTGQLTTELKAESPIKWSAKKVKKNLKKVKEGMDEAEKKRQLKAIALQGGGGSLASSFSVGDLMGSGLIVGVIIVFIIILALFL